MTTWFKIIGFLLLPLLCKTQQSLPDSLRNILLASGNDSVQYKTANHLYDYYEELNRDSAFFYATQSVSVSQKNNRKLNEAYSLTRKAYQELNLGRFAESLHSLLEAFSICEKQENEKSFWQIDPLRLEPQKRLFAHSCTHHIFALLMRRTLNREQAMVHFKEAKRIADEINSPGRSLLGSLNLGRIYLENGRLDSALFYENQAEEIVRSSGRKKYLSTILHLKGAIHMRVGDTARALNFFYECLRSGMDENNMDGLVGGYHHLSEYYFATNNKDSSLHYAIKKIETLKQLRAFSLVEDHIGIAYDGLHKVYYARKQFDSAFKYLGLAQKASDSLNQGMIKSLAEFQKITLDEQQRLQNIEKEKAAYQNRIRIYSMLSGIAVLLLLTIIFYWSNRQKHKAKIQIEQAYHNLQTTQQQLIQSEKMASLGELTAGIAHEIQNPLNFVNNFSEVNTELLMEMKDEMDKGNIDDAKTIANDVIENEQKINHHGKRADAIVKGMLQHSRSGSGVKEPTDINKLVDEYLRLAYHGLRAKDNSFNATMKTDFDAGIGNIDIIPQDVGRVILNLITNAFYAVTEKKNQHTEGYEPIVSISTMRINGKTEIKVSDNGIGIPPNALDKIFQPFFTTKPSGQGTGLGLSLCYDIVKSHGGEIKVNTKENEGAEFIIKLPIDRTL